jgi:hypothetical protein
MIRLTMVKIDYWFASTSTRMSGAFAPRVGKTMEPKQISVLGLYDMALALIAPESTEFFKIFCSTYFFDAPLFFTFGAGTRGLRGKSGNWVFKTLGEEHTRPVIEPVEKRV